MTFLGISANLNPTFGAYLIATFISNLLLGVTCLQTYIYFRTYSDGILIQSSVALLLFFELVHGALSMHVVYHYLVSNFFNPLALLVEHNVWSVNVLFGVTGMIVLIVHLSYATRIYYVSGKKIATPVFVTILSLGNFVLGNVLVVQLFEHPISAALTGKPDDLAKAILISAAVIDVIIAVTLSFYLNRARTGIKQTDKIIDRLMVYTINNGILTSMFDIITVVLVFAFPDDLYSLAVSQVIGKLYSNSLMATFNSRKTLAGRHTTNLEANSSILSSFKASGNSGGASVTPSGVTKVNVALTKEVLRERPSMVHTRSTWADDGSVV